ncbi:MAG: TetR family transcriptional regulator [Pseudomonas fluorescens]|nr:MAG: TetR family transcriptional regulator [Pseudomonas fluorescens]
MKDFLNAYCRKKQPDVVKRQLLDCAAKMFGQSGVANVSLQAIACAAGGTKGGLLHHFPKKEVLIRALFEDEIQQLDDLIETLLEKDEGGYGTFTRAYIKSFLEDSEDEFLSPEAILECNKLYKADLDNLWKDWMNSRLERHRETDDFDHLEVIRFAADGMWFARMLKCARAEGKNFDALYGRLVAMTYDKQG